MLVDDSNDMRVQDDLFDHRRVDRLVRFGRGGDFALDGPPEAEQTMVGPVRRLLSPWFDGLREGFGVFHVELEDVLAMSLSTKRSRVSHGISIEKR